jgi:UDP-glucose 6-dehydrogenase
MRHVADAVNPTTELARPDTPVIVVKATVPPGITACAFAVAVGGAGIETVG